MEILSYDQLITMYHETYQWALDQLPTIRYVVSLSSGTSSAVAAERAIERYGKQNIEMVFCDTTVEDQDNYRFLDDCQKRWDMPLTILRDGRTPLQVAEDEHIIPNQKIAPCTHRLKIEPMQRYVVWLQSKGYRVVMLIGMGLKDKAKGRCEAPIRNWSKLGVWVEYPLLWDKPDHDPTNTVKTWGIEPPRTYALGFPNANCLEQGCVKAGKKTWRRLLTYKPSVYAKTETWENHMRQDPRFAEYSILRDQSDGDTKAMTLKQLREETERASQQQLRLFEMRDDVESDCAVECGVGGG